jgi:hypothetical protein
MFKKPKKQWSKSRRKFIKINAWQLLPNGI